MSETIEITLNGQAVQAPVGATIRDVAQSQGIHIPTFCHDDRLQPFASCFLCVVEVEKARGLLPACSTPVGPGMVIHTDSPRVTDTRRQALNLLLSDHAGDCIAPCEATCPANIDIQGYIAHIANGQFEAAVRLIKQRNPLPVVCGRICPHPCESQCRRGLVDEPVAINPLKRFSAEYELSHGPFLPPVGPDTGKRVAIVGGGPAGLAASYYLRQAGHAVEIFEALPQLGGMARYGIPRFRMPWDLMDKEIQAILGLGVKVHYNQKLGRDVTIADLKGKGFDAILLAIGAHKAKPMRIGNEDVPGVVGGVDFLRQAVLGETTDLKGVKVAVVGGGDTAMDCARVSKRLGAEVALLYRRTQAEMPASVHEQHETREEGIEMKFLVAPVEVVVKDGRAAALRVSYMELGEPDSSGRRRPVPIPDSEEDLPFDIIIAAIGQDPDMEFLAKEGEKPEITRWNTFVYDEKTQVTTMPGVFAAGDCAFGPDILIRAIGEGRRSALAIDLYLQGAEVRLTKPYAISRGRIEELEMADFSPRFVHKKRQQDVSFPAEQRLTNQGGWAAINVGLDQAQAMAESSRCIECGCNARFDCDLRIYSTQYGATEKKLAGARRQYDEDKRHPLIKLEPDKCITCASCVRVCSEVREINALSFINRGFTTHIGPNFNDPLQETGCDACGMCIDVCPTGTLSANTGKETGPWQWEVVNSSCTNCSLACGLAVHVAEGRVVKVRSIDHDPVNGASICAEGRFGYQLMNAAARGDVGKALQKAQELLFQALNLVVVVSPRVTVEEAYVAARLARKNSGALFYAAGGDVVAPVKPRGKVRGEANVALLERLGARPLTPGMSGDCLVLVGTGVDAHLVGSSKVILVSAYDVGVKADAWVETADPLATEGTMLNRDGQLAVLRRALPEGHTGYKMLAALAGEPALADIGFLRQELVREVPTMAGVTQASATTARLIPAQLPVTLVGVPLGDRERAFAGHMKGLGLNW